MARTTASQKEAFSLAGSLSVLGTGYAWNLSKVDMRSRVAGGAILTTPKVLSTIGNAYRVCNSVIGFLKPIKKGSTANATLGDAANLQDDYDLGSMPRCCSSLRNIRFIQVASDESPSLRTSSSSWERSSCARRIWYWSVLVFSLDIVITTLLILFCSCNYNVTSLNFQLLNIVKPAGASNTNGLLTTNANDTSEEAMKNHTTPVNGRDSHTLKSAIQRKRLPATKVLKDTLEQNQLFNTANRLSNQKVDVHKFRLPTATIGCYGFPVAPQWAIRCRNLNHCMATPDALSVFFYVAATAHPFTAHSRLKSMVALVGRRSRLPESIQSGIPTPANVTTPLERRNSGGDSLNCMEIIIMMATPTHTHPTFIWRFFSCQNSTYYTVTATSEREARSLLPDSPCLFAARLPVEVRHV